MRMLIVCVLTCLCSFAAVPIASAAEPGGKRKDKEGETSAARDVNQPPPNACGCYEDSSGQCRCSKKSKCGCPGSCEPAGCEEKRAKELEKEAREETRKQQEEDRKRAAELERRRDDLDKKEAQKKEKGLRGLRLIENEKD
jgi:hypothetical protein